jgi:hypothetical protein
MKTILPILILGFFGRFTSFGTVYYLNSAPGPYPIDPYGGGLPITTLDASHQIYRVEDTPEDYAALQALLMANLPRGDASISADENVPAVDSSDPPGWRVSIAPDDDNTAVVYFDTQPGTIYNVQESNNLLDWITAQTFVADDTNFEFTIYPTDGMKFYRANSPDDRISFPDSDGYVEMFAYFYVSTTIQGTYHEELYGDGNLLFQHDGTVPANGQFGVYDSSYDPNQWPYNPDYSISDWEFRVSVTPAGAGQPAQAVVKKKTRYRTYPRKGITVEMNGIGNPAPGVQDEMDAFMLDYLSASFNACNQVLNLLGIPFNGPPPDFSFVPKLNNASDWSNLKRLVLTNGVTDFHYFGHGTRKGLGEYQGNPNVSILLAELQNSLLKTNPMNYAALDGCRTAGGLLFWQKPDLLIALTGYKKQFNADEAAMRGLHPRFGWGWKKGKDINVVGGTHLNTDHFNFVMDFYSRLCHRDPFTGLLDQTYSDAINFGQHPQGLGNDPYIYDNPEGYFIDWVGCDTYYDAP